MIIDKSKRTWYIVKFKKKYTIKKGNTLPHCTRKTHSKVVCTRTKVDFASFCGNVRWYIRNYSYTRYLRRFYTPSIVVLGFFEYSINVRKSYITNRECTRREDPKRASHASDFYLRPFALAGGKRASGPTFGLPSMSLGLPFFVPSYPTAILFLSRFTSTCILSVESTDWLITDA